VKYIKNAINGLVMSLFERETTSIHKDRVRETSFRRRPEGKSIREDQHEPVEGCVRLKDMSGKNE